MAEYRLDKFLTLTGAGTRSQVKELIRKGRVLVNGKPEKRPEKKINPERDQVSADGKEIRFTKSVYYMLNKPAGVVTATEDRIHRTVIDLLEDKRTDLFPVGRLDIDTEGLLLITNDGILGHQLLSPKKHVDKTYYVETDRLIPADAKERFAAGMDLGDFTARPARLEILDDDGMTCRVSISEGKFHQIKRMFAKRGMEVLSLRRVAMGGILLDDTLGPGGFRRLTQAEREYLTDKCGIKQEIQN